LRYNPPIGIYRRTLSDGRTVYDVKVSVRGRQVMERGLTFEEAQERELELKLLRRRSSRVPSDLTLAELASAWLEEKRLRNKEATFRDYEQVTRLHIHPALGGERVRHLTPYQISRLISSLAHRPRTANKALTALKQMLKLAVVWGVIAQNPAQEISRVPYRGREMEYLTPEEVARVLEVLEGDEIKYLLVLTAALTGLRSAELRGLRWGDIEGPYIFVRREYKGGRFQEPKTEASRRRVLMPPFLRERLERVRGGRDELVFSRNGKPLSDDYPTRYVLAPALRAAKIGKRVTFHALRHSYAAWMLSEGESPQFVRAQLGHTDPAFTLRMYGHFMPEKHEEVAERMERRLISRMAVSKLYHEKSEQIAEVIPFSQVNDTVRP